MPVPVSKLRSGQAEVDAFAQQVKANLDWLTGQQKNAPALAPLPTSATLDQVIAAHNLIIQRLNG